MIRSRKECYDYIKANSELKDKIYNEMGRHYTNLSNETLNFFVEMDYNSLWNRIKRFFHK